jgi:hypothetical protein
MKHRVVWESDHNRWSRPFNNEYDADEFAFLLASSPSILDVERYEYEGTKGKTFLYKKRNLFNNIGLLE